MLSEGTPPTAPGPPSYVRALAKGPLPSTPGGARDEAMRGNTQTAGLGLPLLLPTRSLLSRGFAQMPRAHQLIPTALRVTSHRRSALTGGRHLPHSLVAGRTRI